MAIYINGTKVAGNGLSPYLIAIAGGYTGTEEEFNKDLSRINQSVLKTGDTMTGPLFLRENPTEELEAVSKKYVDDSIANFDIWYCGTSAPDNKKLLWIDTNESGGLKRYDSQLNLWVHIPVASN